MKIERLDCTQDGPKLSADYQAFSHPRMSLGNRDRICGLPLLDYCFVVPVPGPAKGRPGQRLGLGWFWFSFSLEGFCVLMPELSVVPQGRPTGGWAPSHADVARVIRLMLSAVLKSSRTTSVWLLAWRWPPACPFAAAPNLPSPG